VKTAVIILGHGSKNSGAGDAVQRIAAEMKVLAGYGLVEHAFLQHTSPFLLDVLESCVKQQAERIVIVPFFMQAGAHVTRDIPGLIEKARERHPNVDIIVTDYAGAHPMMAKIVADLVQLKVGK